MDNTEERVHRVVAEQFGHQPTKVKNESHLVNDLGGDSLDIVELMMCIEEEFNLEIPDEDWNVNTIQQVIDVVRKHQGT